MSGVRQAWRGGQLIAAVLVMVSSIVALHLVVLAWGPVPDRRLGQVEFLDGAISGGAAQEMQQIFPEGAWFTIALTGVAEARLAADPLVSADRRDVLVTRARERLAALDAPSSTDVFGSGMLPDHGIFVAGWSTALAADIAEATGEQRDLDELDQRATQISEAVTAAPGPFLESYPQQFWPCDTVVAVSALARAGRLLDRPEWSAQVSRWRDQAAPFVEPASGLLPHRVDGTGAAMDGPRGSSQAIIQTFWPDLAATTDPAAVQSWARFVERFVTREAGLVGVREYPQGSTGASDVDSGPLLFGVSASASAVTVAAARRNGDTDLADTLQREAELLGAPLALGDGDRYAFGLLPVGDAFLVWARTQPLPADDDPVPRLADIPAPLWPSALLIPVGLLLVGVRILRRPRWGGRTRAPARTAVVKDQPK